VKVDPALPHGIPITVYRHRVAYYETDAMGVVHHSNYLRFFEGARVRWLEEHDKPYTHYVENAGLNFAVTRSEVDYKNATRFDDIVEVATWMLWVRGASLAMAYRATVGDRLVAQGLTEHAALSIEGRVRRIPQEDRVRLSALSLEALAAPPGSAG